jgi:pimeloyl-ACP methyl ester carboxylesterase
MINHSWILSGAPRLHRRFSGFSLGFPGLIGYDRCRIEGGRSMDLEVISHRPKGGVRATPLLFVHGAYAGAWIWEPYFLPFFARHGYEAHALSLRGHGGSGGSDELMSTRLRDFVADVEQVMTRLPAPPIVIGHSMGGVVVQQVMHRHRDILPGAVLMASGPPHGLVGSLWNMAFERPELLWQIMQVELFGQVAIEESWVRRALFSEHTPDHVVRRYMPQLGRESLMVCLDLLGLDLPPSTRMLDMPVLVLGAERDPFIYQGALEQTARTYGTRPEVFAGMAHAMMIDYDWEKAAVRILHWLEATLPATRSAA